MYKNILYCFTTYTWCKSIVNNILTTNFHQLFFSQINFLDKICTIVLKKNNNQNIFNITFSFKCNIQKLEYHIQNGLNCNILKLRYVNEMTITPYIEKYLLLVLCIT